MGLFDWLFRVGKPPEPRTDPPGPTIEQARHRTEVHDLSPDDIARLGRSFGDGWPADAALVEAIYWHGEDGVRLEKITIQAAEPPRDRIWILRRGSDEDILLTRPATAAELQELIAVLRDAGASDEDVATPAAGAHLDCSGGGARLSFTTLTEMSDGVPYKQWQVRYHGDGRPPSVAFLLVTRRNDWFHSLPGGAVLRGTPWET